MNQQNSGKTVRRGLLRNIHDGALCATTAMAFLLMACLPMISLGAAPAQALVGLVVWCACGLAAFYILHAGLPVKLPGHPVSFAVRGLGLLLMWPAFMRRTRAAQ